MAQRRVLFIHHLDYETGGHASTTLESAEIPTRRVAFPAQAPPLDEIAGIIAFGGQMAADQIEQFPSLQITIDLLRRAVDAEIPVFGLCLGHQMLGMALGARLHPGAVDEVGLHSLRVIEADPYLNHHTGELSTIQWHTDTVELPAGATLLATNQTCENQGFRYGSAVGLQFHLEVDRQILDLWLDEEGMTAELTEGETAENLRERFAQSTGLSEIAAAGFSAFADDARRRVG